MQMFEWGEVKSPYGWQPIRLMFSAGGQVRAVASVLKRAVGPFSMCYMPKGPVMDYDDEDVAGQVLDAVVKLARRQRAIYIKMDSDILAEDTAAIQVLERHGFRHSDGQVQVGTTMMLDITGSEDEVLGRMKPKCRYNIRLAEKRGIEIVQGTAADLPEAYRIYQETGERDGFIVRPYEYCKLQWETYLNRDMANFWLAKYEGQALAVIMPFAAGRRMWYFFGASRSVHRNLMSPHLLQWRAIQWGRERGCTEYDMWGAPEVLEEGQPLWGVYLFKQGFGAEYVRWAGAFDYVLQPALHALWIRGVPAYMRLVRRLKNEHVDERQISGV